MKNVALQLEALSKLWLSHKVGEDFGYDENQFKSRLSK